MKNKTYTIDLFSEDNVKYAGTVLWQLEQDDENIFLQKAQILNASNQLVGQRVTVCADTAAELCDSALYDCGDNHLQNEQCHCGAECEDWIALFKSQEN